MISVSGVTKHFDEVHALSKIDFSIEKGEFVTIVGPSGCGKSTLLQMIAGGLRDESAKTFYSDACYMTLSGVQLLTAWGVTTLITRGGAARWKGVNLIGSEKVIAQIAATVSKRVGGMKDGAQKLFDGLKESTKKTLKKALQAAASKKMPDHELVNFNKNVDNFVDALFDYMHAVIKKGGKTGEKSQEALTKLEAALDALPLNDDQMEIIGKLIDDAMKSTDDILKRQLKGVKADALQEAAQIKGYNDQFLIKLQSYLKSVLRKTTNALAEYLANLTKRRGKQDDLLALGDEAADAPIVVNARSNEVIADVFGGATGRAADDARALPGPEGATGGRVNVYDPDSLAGNMVYGAKVERDVARLDADNLNGVNQVVGNAATGDYVAGKGMAQLAGNTADQLGAARNIFKQIKDLLARARTSTARGAAGLTDAMAALDDLAAAVEILARVAQKNGGKVFDKIISKVLQQLKIDPAELRNVYKQIDDAAAQANIASPSGPLRAGTPLTREQAIDALVYLISQKIGVNIQKLERARGGADELAELAKIRKEVGNILDMSHEAAARQAKLPVDKLALGLGISSVAALTALMMLTQELDIMHVDPQKEGDALDRYTGFLFGDEYIAKGEGLLGVATAAYLNSIFGAKLLSKELEAAQEAAGGRGETLDPENENLRQYARQRLAGNMLWADVILDQVNAASPEEYYNKGKAVEKEVTGGSDKAKRLAFNVLNNDLYSYFNDLMTTNQTAEDAFQAWVKLRQNQYKNWVFAGDGAASSREGHNLTEEMRDINLFLVNTDLKDRLGKFLRVAPENRKAKNLNLVFSVTENDVTKVLEYMHEMDEKIKKIRQEDKDRGLREGNLNYLRELVTETLNEYNGGYTPYPYHSEIGTEGEEAPDFAEDWKDFELSISSDRSRANAIELAKALVKDLELFGDVIDLVGNNQSVATEILKKFRKTERKH